MKAIPISYLFNHNGLLQINFTEDVLTATLLSMFYTGGYMNYHYGKWELVHRLP